MSNPPDTLSDALNTALWVIEEASEDASTAVLVRVEAIFSEIDQIADRSEFDRESEGRHLTNADTLTMINHNIRAIDILMADLESRTTPEMAQLRVRLRAVRARLVLHRLRIEKEEQ